MYERHSMLGEARRKSAATVPETSFSRKKKKNLNYQELSQGQLKEINSCDEKILEPHPPNPTHTEECQTLKTT